MRSPMRAAHKSLASALTARVPLRQSSTSGTAVSQPVSIPSSLGYRLASVLWSCLLANPEIDASRCCSAELRLRTTQGAAMVEACTRCATAAMASLSLGEGSAEEAYSAI